jgi:hypothetical protein
VSRISDWYEFQFVRFAGFPTSRFCRDSGRHLGPRQRSPDCQQWIHITQRSDCRTESLGINTHLQDAITQVNESMRKPARQECDSWWLPTILITASAQDLLAIARGGSFDNRTRHVRQE